LPQNKVHNAEAEQRKVVLQLDEMNRGGHKRRSR
jgi:hypothetical protein